MKKINWKNLIIIIIVVSVVLFILFKNFSRYILDLFFNGTYGAWQSAIIVATVTLIVAIITWPFKSLIFVKKNDNRESHKNEDVESNNIISQINDLTDIDSLLYDLKDSINNLNGLKQNLNNIGLNMITEDDPKIQYNLYTLSKDTIINCSKKIIEANKSSMSLTKKLVKKANVYDITNKDKLVICINDMNTIVECLPSYCLSINSSFDIKDEKRRDNRIDYDFSKLELRIKQLYKLCDSASKETKSLKSELNKS